MMEKCVVCVPTGAEEMPGSQIARRRPVHANRGSLTGCVIRADQLLDRNLYEIRIAKMLGTVAMHATCSFDLTRMHASHCRPHSSRNPKRIFNASINPIPTRRAAVAR